MITEAFDADFADLLAGKSPRGLKLPEGAFEAPGVLTMLRELAEAIRPVFAPASWLVIAHGEVVGLCSVVRMPTDGAIDIGYGIMQDRRGKGYATRAVREMVTWARSDQRVHLRRAETSIHNRPSQRVLEVNGFQRVGMRSDEEDGDLICWGLPVGR